MYGEEISYEISLVKSSDKKLFELFSCGNISLDKYIKSEIFEESSLVNPDGLHFKVTTETNGKIVVIGFFSLATSGIIHRVENYSHIFPSIKIDVFAIDKNYQKLHYDKASETAENPDDHYYFSDDIMGQVIRHCRKINDEYVLSDYVILYADKNALRFYHRNMFEDYTEFMEPEQNQEVKKLYPMFFTL
ncbi:MAG: hypothetical protein KBT11_02230 [Treponema sp.]|nr:hypothetical protein [Candidatus Treponema equifaecale]